MDNAIFLDRDGTLNEDTGYTYKTGHFKLQDGVIEGLLLLKGFRLFIITNQSGIGRGYYKEEDMHRFNHWMLKEFERHNIKVEEIYFCPHAPEENCQCRKPNIKFITEAENEFNLDIKNSYVIGDHPSDIQLANNAGCKAVYLITGHGRKHLNEARKLRYDYVAATFKQAAEFISFDNELKNGMKKEEKLISRKDLADLIGKLKNEGKKIATLNGTFDILHIGHEKILCEAKQQGDILIVAVNSDSSVRQNKGKDRPINNENARAKMLANFDNVDYVTIFPEITPVSLLEIIKPDVHVNGSEYGENCIEASTVKKYGGRIHIVELVKGYSTTNLIKGDN